MYAIFQFYEGTFEWWIWSVQYSNHFANEQQQLLIFGENSDHFSLSSTLVLIKMEKTWLDMHCCSWNVYWLFCWIIQFIHKPMSCIQFLVDIQCMLKGFAGLRVTYGGERTIPRSAHQDCGRSKSDAEMSRTRPKTQCDHHNPGKICCVGSFS